MATAQYYAEMQVTGQTNFLIEDYMHVKKSSTYKYLGLGIVPVTNLDIYGQMRISSGTTNYEGELRYKDKFLWINTGGTISDWILLTTSNQFSGATDPDFWYDSPNETLYVPEVKMTNTTGFTSHAASYNGLFIDTSNGKIYSNSGVTIANNYNDYILTATGNQIINGESEFSYDSSKNLLLLINLSGDMTSQISGKNTLLNLWSADNTPGTNEFRFSKQYDVKINDEIGSIIWKGEYSSNEYVTSSIYSVANENWEVDSYGSDLYIKTVKKDAGTLTSRIHVDSKGYTNIENGLFAISQSFVAPLNVVTTATTLSDLHYTVIMDTTTNGAQKITLPAANAYGKIIYNIKRYGGSNVNVTSTGGENIYFGLSAGTYGTTFNISQNGYAVTLQSDGSSKWYIIGVLNNLSP